MAKKTNQDIDNINIKLRDSDILLTYQEFNIMQEEILNSKTTAELEKMLNFIKATNSIKNIKYNTYYSNRY